MSHDDHQIGCERNPKLTDSQVRAATATKPKNKQKKKMAQKKQNEMNVQKKVCKAQIVELKTSISQSICQPAHRLQPTKRNLR